MKLLKALFALILTSDSESFVLRIMNSGVSRRLLLESSRSDSDWTQQLLKRTVFLHQIEEPWNHLASGIAATAEKVPDKFFILMIQPDTDKQGVHTIEFPAGSGRNLVLAFESKDSCRKFAEHLSREKFINPTVRESA